ncbi:MAG: hypothetical protein ACJAUE_002245 [Alcanivorax sp.]
MKVQSEKAEKETGSRHLRSFAGATVGAQLEGRTERSKATKIRAYPQRFMKPAKLEHPDLFALASCQGKKFSGFPVYVP